MALHRVKLTDYKQKKRDEDAIEIETDDGSIFRIEPPELWSDDVMQLAQDGDNIGCSRLLVGGDQYDAFVAAGGSAALVMGIIAEVHGATVPESLASVRS